jgi:hypothetical protein
MQQTEHPENAGFIPRPRGPHRFIRSRPRLRAGLR